MPQPSTERSALTSFLSQFADSSEEPIAPATILNGEHPAANGAHGEIGAYVENGAAHFSAPSNRLNGHAAELENAVASDEINGHGHSSFLAADNQNGAGDEVLLDTIEAHPEAALNGTGELHLNGTAKYVSALDPVVDAVRTSEPMTYEPPIEAPVGRVSDIEVAEPANRAATAAEEMAQASEIIGESPTKSTASAEHPACGSLFTPYLVTEIRELRNRCNRRRSWWRRLFG